MSKKIYAIDHAGLPVWYRFRYEDTARYFGWHMAGSRQDDGTMPACDILSVSDELFKARDHIFSPRAKDAFKEYRILAGVTGRSLSTHRRFIMHAAAFIWKEKAWLYTAPSGTGKTTQYLNWKRLYPEEVQILCGDMPLLHWQEDGRIMVCPSPWNGNERLGEENRLSAPLGGIVYLAQSNKDLFAPADLYRLVRPIWFKLIGQVETEEQIRARGEFLDHMLSAYPVWLLENRGDEASVLLARDAFERVLQGRGQ